MQLNEKLSLWAGFKWDEDIKHWDYPDGSPHFALPNFTESLDACFKWLVPKLRDKYNITIELLQDLPTESIIDIWSNDCPQASAGRAQENGVALALCLAIEKLIDEKN